MHGYSASHVETALDSLARLEQPMSITWAVRLPIIRQTSAALVRRLTQRGRTLTCWGDMGEAEERWLSSPHIRPLAFVDSTTPGPFLQATYWTQLAAALVLFGALSAMLHARSKRGTRLLGAVISGKSKDLSV